jgi:hypothetical protein
LKTKDFFRINLCDLGFFDSLNEPLHVTAARWRFRMTLNGSGWAAALERGRWAGQAVKSFRNGQWASEQSALDEQQ